LLTDVDPGTGHRDVRRPVELFTMLKRAGATATVTYAAVEIARQLIWPR
jgi:porphobilinogen synthase